MSERINIDELLRRHTFDHAVICTFTFDPIFFENYCLDRYRALADNRNVSVLLDQFTYDQILVAPAGSRPRLANVRYLLHPIAVPGTFHPKLFLFTAKDRGLLVIGSGNFTKTGLTSNAELVTALRFERGKREEFLDVFRQARRFLTRVATRWPSEALLGNLQDLCDETDWIAADPEDDGQGPRLVDSLDRSIWSQLIEGIPAGVDELHVLSRFFDTSPTSSLGKVEKDLAPKKTVLWTQNGITTMTPAWYEHAALAGGTASVKDCVVSDEDHNQPLHAKAVAIVRGKRVRLGFGSANFTTSGMFSTATSRNVEIMLVSDDVPLSSCRPATLFDPLGTARDLIGAELKCAPPDDPVDLLHGVGMRLEEAKLTERSLSCLSEPLVGPAKVTAHLSFVDGGVSEHPLVAAGSSLQAQLDQATCERCNEATLVHLSVARDGHATLKSNLVLLINLRSIDSGQSRSRDRRIRAATRSAAQFAEALDELLRIGDQEALKNFFTYCDIPLVGAARALTLPRARAEAPIESELRALGARNLRTYVTLHAAALGFCDRHLRRLRRHAKKPSIAGIPNFMHVALAICGVISAQVERAVIGLEETREPIDNEAWADHRDRLDLYLMLLRETLELVQVEYVGALRKTYPQGQIRAAIAPDLAPLRRMIESFLKVNSRVVACCASTLKVRTPMRLVQPPFYPKNIVGGPKWSDVATVMNGTARWADSL